MPGLEPLELIKGVGEGKHPLEQTRPVVRAITSGSHVRSWRRMRGRQETTLWASEPAQRGSEEPTLRARAAGGKEPAV